MAANKSLHMTAGDGETSYANNSGLQKVAISKSLGVLDETLEDMFSDDHIINDFPKCFKIVDLGCASGPNTLSAVTHIMNKIRDLCKQNINININNDSLEFEVFLNDLPDNDFNNLFKYLPKKMGQCFIYGLPGSFYGRLLPEKSVHFAFSSYSIHWLSQIPQGLEYKNKENMYMAMTSPPEVYEAYANQYKRDITTFLSLRASEIIPGGRMVLLFMARSVEDPSTHDGFPIFAMLSKTLAEMVPEGLVKMDDLYSFNLPIYGPCIKEVEAGIESEGSFTLDKLDTYTVSMGNNPAATATAADDQQDLFIKRGKIVSDFVRGFMGPMLASHFGSSIMDDLFGRYTKTVAEFAQDPDGGSFNIVISLTRK